MKTATIKTKGKKLLDKLRKNLMQYTWWEIVIFVIGCVSFVSLLVVLFFPIGKGPSKFTYTGKIPGVGSADFAPMLSQVLTLPWRDGNNIEILKNGDAFLKSLLSDIDNAKSSINIMVYILTEGKMSDQIFEHLDQKLKDGVQVRIMYDSYGSKFHRPKDQLKAFEDLGGKVGVFHSFTITPWQLLKNQLRDHRKAFIIDGKIGYVGGMSIDDHWLGNATNPKEYHDFMFRTEGPMAADIQGTFAELWSSMTAEIFSGSDFYPPNASNSISAKAGGLKYMALTSTPSADSLALQKFFLLSILSAQHKLHITSPYFIPDPSLKDALIQKAKEGVDVEILVPNKLNDSKSVYYSSHASYKELLEGGVKIFEYQPTFNHSKTLLVDGVWSIIGSSNLDNRSRKLNEENVYGIYDKGFNAELEKIFEEDKGKAKEIELPEWNRRGIWQHILENVAQQFVVQY